MFKVVKKNRAGGVIQVFMDCDMRSQHHGLSLIAAKQKVDTRNIPLGSFVIFINRRQDKVKIFASNNVLAYYKNNTRIDLLTIAEIPKVFNGVSINYDAALKAALNKRLLRASAE